MLVVFRCDYFFLILSFTNAICCLLTTFLICTYLACSCVSVGEAFHLSSCSENIFSVLYCSWNFSTFCTRKNLIMTVGEIASLNKRNFNWSIFKVKKMFYIGADLKIFILWLLESNSSIPKFWKKCGVFYEPS